MFAYHAQYMYGASLCIQGAKEMDLDGSKQLDEKTRSDIAQLKEQLETQVHVFYTCTCMYID